MEERGRNALGAVELTHLARSATVYGLRVQARCFAVGGERSPRYEIVLAVEGQCGVVDVTDEGQLASRIDEAVKVFAAAARVRASHSAEPLRNDGPWRVGLVVP